MRNGLYAGGDGHHVAIGDAAREAEDWWWELVESERKDAIFRESVSRLPVRGEDRRTRLRRKVRA